MNEAGLEGRVARIEGILSQMDKRLNHIETEIGGLRNELRNKADKWEIRIWFLIVLLMTAVVGRAQVAVMKISRG